MNAQIIASLMHPTLEMKVKQKTKKSAAAFVPNIETRTSSVGGMNQLANYLADELVYPELGRENDLEGTVLVEFTIGENGDIQDANIVEGLGLGFDKEALRLVKKMPNWRPARQGVRRVASKIRMPIAFGL